MLKIEETLPLDGSAYTFTMHHCEMVYWEEMYHREKKVILAEDVLKA